MNKNKFSFPACFFMAALCCCADNGCAPGGPNARGGATSVAELKVTAADSTGWAPDTTSDTFGVYTAGNLNLLLDGGNEEYISHGVVEVSVQNLVGPDSQTMNAMCMDFGTANKAFAMFSYKESTLSNGLTISPFDSSTAIAKALPLLKGISAYAWLDKFYIELQLTGFADQVAAISTASSFLKLYSSKIK